MSEPRKQLRTIDARHDRDLERSPEDVSDQLPYGDFTPGRFAWLLERPRPLSEPLVWRGAQGLRRLPDEVAREVEART